MSEYCYSNVDEVCSEAAGGTLILTANRRLFRHLRTAYDRWMQQQGHQVWAPPQMFSYEGWMIREFESLFPELYLLNRRQELCLWETAIKRSASNVALELLQLEQTAEKASQAHHLLNEYRITTEDRYFSGEDQQMFLLWRQSYCEDCRQHNYVDRSDVSIYMVEALQQGTIQLAPKLMLVGFDQLPPGLEQIRRDHEARGDVCQVITPVLHDEPCGHSYAALDSREEIETAARWTRNLLEQGARSIGIIVPDLNAQKARLERIFQSQISPQTLLQHKDDETTFSLSLGGSLADEGLVASALDLLSCSYELSLDQVSNLLRNIRLHGGHSDADGRALFERYLRSTRQGSFRLSRLQQWCREYQYLDSFSRILDVISAALKGGKLLPSEWSRSFADQLMALGWPGERSLSSREYQALNVWRSKILSALSGLDTFVGRLSRSEALSLLRRMTQECEFQIEAPIGRVQVIGLLESSGLEFEHLWVMGLEDRILPARPQPNPFIPQFLQNKYQLPRSNAQRELTFARQVIARLRRSAGQAVFSYPQQEGDSRLRPSPLIKGFSPATLQLSEYADPLSLARRLGNRCQPIADQQGTALAAGLVKGGTSLLKDQAHCPFRAFVHHRLGCHVLDQASSGIDAITRGQLLHQILDDFWSEIQTQQALLSMEPNQLEQLVDQITDRCLQDYYGQTLETAKLSLQLERNRLVALILEWLDRVESVRDPFTVVAAEKELVRDFSALQLRLKVDRIDELADGSHVIIDYKSGTDQRAADFLTVPLLEPQLPVYAISKAEGHIRGLSFARVRKGDCRFIGMVAEAGQLGRLKDVASLPQAQEAGIDNWNDLVLHWRQQIEQLADDFSRGAASVRPFSPERSCIHCDLAGLCRYGEVAAMEDVYDQ